MNSEESYLDSLLRNILNPEAAEPGKEESQIAEERTVQELELKETEAEKTETVTDTSEGTLISEGIADIAEEPLILEEETELSKEAYRLEEPLLSEEVSEIPEEAQIPEEIQLSEEISEIPEEAQIPEEIQLSEEISEISEEAQIPEEIQLSEEISEIPEEIQLSEEISEIPEEAQIPEEIQLSEEISEIPEEIQLSEEISEIPEEPLLQLPEDILDGLEEPSTSEDLLLSEEISSVSDQPSIMDLTTDFIDTEVIESVESPTVEEETSEITQPIIEDENELETELPVVDYFGTEEIVAINAEETNAEESALATVGTSDSGGGFSLEDKEMPESDDDFKLEDIEIPELSDLGVFQDNELNIDALEDAIQSETEREMAGELNIDDLTIPMSDFNLSDFDMDDLEMKETEVLDNSEKDLDIKIPDISEDSNIVGNSNESDTSINMDDNLEDVLNMLDDDAELAEINDMLKKSDNNEPIQDDMMDLLNQMADDEAASVNAGLNHTDEDDGGVPLPVIPKSVLEETRSTEKADGDENKKTKKASAKKKKNAKETEDAEVETKKEPGRLGKFFNMLTEDLVPEPTEEELAAEKEAKKAKKQEEQTKKEEEKLAKDEEKKAKAEEKAAAKKAKQEEAAKKRQEKKAQKEAKRAKQAANGLNKRIPPKKIAVVAAFGVSVGGAVLVATNVLSTQGFLQTARNAYYKQDYKTVYQATYGMELNGKETESLIKEKSEIIYKMQRKYDSYQNNLKMGRELEALDALLQGLVVYDTINADAQAYEVTTEVDELKATICNILETKYHLDETQARTLLSNEDPLTYTIALNDVITQS